MISLPRHCRYPVIGVVATLSHFTAGPCLAQALISPAPLRIVGGDAIVCADRDAVLITRRAEALTNATWSFSPASAGAFVDDKGTPVRSPQGNTVRFHTPGAVGETALYGTVTITAVSPLQNTKSDTARTSIHLGGLCETSYGGEITRATIGFEQIGAGGIESTQKYAFDFFISRPVPFRRSRTIPTDPDEFFFGKRLRWWGDVRLASYPQQVTSDAVTFAKDLASSTGKLSTSQLVQSAEFTTGIELRITDVTWAVSGAPDRSRQRFALMAVGGFGAVGPFPAPGDDLPVFDVPKTANSPQAAAFSKAYPDVTSSYVAFRTKVPDRFLGNSTIGLRLYTFYAGEGATSKPIQIAPASITVAYGKNELVAPNGGRAWHVSAYYPFAFGDRADDKTLIVYLFGDVWMAKGAPNFSAPGFQLSVAKANDKPIPLTDPQVTIITEAPKPRDTYRIGVSLDLIKVWSRLTQSSANPPAAPPDK